MKHVHLLVVLILALVIPGQRNSPVEMTALAQSAGPPVATLETQQQVVSQYCAGCHSDSARSGGFTWSSIDLASPGKSLETAERVIRKVRAGMMPPAGARRPDVATLKAFAAGLETKVDQAAAASPYVRSPELHRKNRTEYQNSVRDLIGLQVDVGDLLPPDARTSSGLAGGGFDNMSEALTVTPSLLGAYVRAADKISRDAVGDPKAGSAMKTYKVSRLQNQMRHVEGTPLGTRGGISVLHTFPADGDYIFKANLYYYYTEEVIGLSLPKELQGQQIEFSVDGEPMATLTIDPFVKESGANYVSAPVKVKAGQRRVSAAFIAKFDGPVQDHGRLVENTILDTTISVTPEMTGLPHLQAFAITGPLNPTGVSDNSVRSRIFTCRPTSASDNERCANQILSRLASQAFRRPANAEDMESLMEFFKTGVQAGGFDEGIRLGLQAILSKPEFVFRFERRPANIAEDQAYKIGDVELASRLAYFLWSSIPDETLLNVAAQGRLSDPAVLEQQVRRMLTDRRSEALSTNFAAQWLRLTGLNDTAPESLLFPDFTRQLAVSMRREVELLFDHIVRDNRSVLDLVTAEYTFVDETLARHYGIPNITGSNFKRVTVTDPSRFGLLGKAGVLTLTSLANRTSPVARGKYVLEVMMGSSPPLPPPVVPPLKEQVDNQKVLSVRQRMEEHRDNPACSSCHRIMDPIGLSLENFDAVGLWRTSELGLKVDPTGEMYDGFKLDGPVSLRRAVMNRSEAFLGTFTENLFTYGVGRVLEHHDMTTVRTIAREAGRDNNRFASFVLGVVKSPQFMMRRSAATVVDAR